MRRSAWPCTTTTARSENRKCSSGDFGCMYMSKYVSSKVTIVRDATDSTTRRAVIRLPGMHSVKQLNLRGLGGASCGQITFLIVAGAPWPWSHPPSPLVVHKAQTLKFPQIHFSMFPFSPSSSGTPPAPSPLHPTHLAVVVWVAPIDDDDPLPLLRPYSKRPGGLRHIYFANSSRPCTSVNR